MLLPRARENSIMTIIATSRLNKAGAILPVSETVQCISLTLIT